MNYPLASELKLSCGPDAVNRSSGTILLIAYEQAVREQLTPFAACSLFCVLSLKRNYFVVLYLVSGALFCFNV